MSGQPSQKDLLALVRMLEATSADVRSAENAESEARKIATAARNRLNDIQKRVDEVVQALRASAPSGSDWHRTVNDSVYRFLRVAP